MVILIILYQRQHTYIRELESIQQVPGNRSLLQRELEIETVELSVEKYIDERNWYHQADQEVADFSAFRKQLETELVTALLESGLVKIKLYTIKDEQGHPLPLWESLLKASLLVCKIP
ncbi:hypothetical protein [Chitinophaga arvensicola]|uniref:hypothetical protein n=1 Tax=Chitinophaga arvensicola TaxID=29529 RepID=UPI00115FFC62|nr:hypothetical protein [Chitinophaga arvensicola]